MAEEFKNVNEELTAKIPTAEPSSATGEVKDRGLFDFMGKKDEVKPQDTPLTSEFENKAEISEPTLVEKLHQKHEEEEENKPSLLQKLHRSNSSSSSSSDEEEGEKKKKKNEKKIVEGDEEKKGIMDKIKEKLPGHVTKPEVDVPVSTTAPVVSEPVPVTEHPVEYSAENPEEKKGFLEKIKEKLPGYHAKSGEEEEEKKVKESD